MRRWKAQRLSARIAGLAIVFLLLASVRSGPTKGAETVTEPQYLLFQIFTAGPEFTTVPGKHVISSLPPPGFIDSQAKNIVDTIGQVGDASHRLGVMVGPLSLDYTDAQLRTLIQETFAVAQKYKIAVGFHIDDSKFWSNRRDLWSNPANVEWLDWKGTPNTGQYLDWGTPWKLAPQACFNSPAMLREARRMAGSVIGPAVAAQIARLRRAGEEQLFAGIIVGWETAIGRDYDTHRDLGYCALTNLGFSASAPPQDRDAQLGSVVQHWIATWTESLEGAGIPRDKLYSHIAFMSRQQFDETHRSGGRSYAETVMFTPPSAAFGGSHRPGFTAYRDPDVLEDIRAALDADGSPPWASAEGTNVNMRVWPPRVGQLGMQDYLARRFNHGAELVNIFGWGVGGRGSLFRRATQSDQALAAYRTMLSGGQLQEMPTAQPGHGDLSDLQRRVRSLPARIQSYRNAGGDLSLVEPRLARLEADIRGGQLEGIKTELTKIEAVLHAKTAP